jgi:cardiolipin synthase
LPGFVHAKVFSSDGTKAVVGTVNLDYRSLYHHFECGLYMSRVPEITKIEWDFAETLEECKKITPEDLKNEKLSRRIMGVLLKVVAPLM